MSISVHQGADKKNIMVLGDIREQTETLLLNMLREPNDQKVEVSFFDATMVKAKVVQGLHHFLNQNPDNQISVYQSTLAQYLHKLDIACRHRFAAHNAIEKSPFNAIALGGSADSLDKIIHIIQNLPVSALSVFIVQHVMEDNTNYLDELLRTRTDYTLLMPFHMTAIEPSTIYIAPAGYQMRVHDGLVYLTRDRKRNYARPSIDILFESLGSVYKEHLLAVLLCGFGRDGVDSLHHIRQQGGWVLVENGEECDAPVLVEAAIAEKAYDQICTVEEISAHCAAATGHVLDSALTQTFLKAIDSRYGYQFQHYASGTLERRIKRLMHASGYDADQFFAFQRDVLTQPRLYEQLFLSFSIGVTRFFRHPEQFSWLRSHVLPYLESFPYIRIWVAGCASGEEAFSLAILLEEAGLLEKSRIYATDINPILLQHATNGLFGRDGLETFSENHQKSGGRGTVRDSMVDNGRYLALNSRFQDKILWYHHSLVSDGAFNEFQLIMCRNVLIYFNSELQRKVMKLFARSLHPRGFLMLGAQEGIHPGGGQTHFKVMEKQLKFFQLKDGYA
ncbi:MAG: hypothetical protein HQL54_08245 [Magnetococcales bacterium]|nr:hypothetical protein [Magnetococcales bacterium]